MAKVTGNRALNGIRGSIDGFTYRVTPEGVQSVYAYHAPDDEPSEVQKSKRFRFACAQYYAAEVLEDPLQRAVYQKIAKQRKRPTNTILVGNYLNPPAIELVELGKYTGQAGQEIGIVAFDDIAVASVKVEIVGAGDAILESGHATEKHGVWRYKTTTTVPEGTAWRVNVTVTNRAEHAAIASAPDPRSTAGAVPGGGITFSTKPPKA